MDAAQGCSEQSAASGGNEEAVRARLRLIAQETPGVGYKAAHSALQADEAFKGVGMKKVQKLLREVREEGDAAETGPSAGSATGIAAAIASAATTEVTITISRPDTSHKFGMLIGTEVSRLGGQPVTDVRAGGVIEAWNKERPESAVKVGDVIAAVNGKTTFEEMMNEFKSCLSVTLRLRPARGGADAEKEDEAKDGSAASMREDHSEGDKEAAAWQARRARVTAALIPGLKKLIDAEMGAGASGRIGRVEEMYQRVGRGEVFEQDSDLGKIFAPGYVADLTPLAPFHKTQDYPWCAELRSQWKAIRKELHANLDESCWMAGAYESSNSAYGPDWKIMGVFTADKWQDEKRFAVTTKVLKNLQGVKLTEAFFARMPPHTKIAPHSDNLNYVLTSHLALELEEGKCSITVGNSEKKWKEGEMLVLDTSFIHSTKNESDKPRYILVARFWHPGLTEEERRAIHLSHAILAGTAKK